MKSEKAPWPLPLRDDAMRKRQSVNQEAGSELLEPCSWTSSLQDCKQYISVVYKPPNLWYFVIAAQRDYDNYYLSMGLLVSRA